MRVTGYFRIAVKIHSVIERTSTYECTEALCHSKERIHNIKTYATYSQTDRWYFLIIWNTQSWWCILRVTGYCTITDEYVKWLRVPRTMNRLKLCAIERNALTIPKRVQRTAKWTFPIVCSTQSCWCILQVTGHLTVTVKYNQWFGVPRDMNLLKFCVIHYIKARATYSQINWQMTYADNLQNIILMMFF